MSECAPIQSFPPFSAGAGLSHFLGQFWVPHSAEQSYQSPCALQPPLTEKAVLVKIAAVLAYPSITIRLSHEKWYPVKGTQEM